MVDHLTRYLTRIFQGKVAIVGVGNMLRGDDGFGPALIERIQGTVQATCIDAGPAPENYLGVIVRAKPDTILFIDAANIDMQPGAYAILKKEDIAGLGLTTHDIPLGMLMDYLEKESRAQICILAVQPAQVAFGSVMSGCVVKALDQLSALIGCAAKIRPSTDGFNVIPDLIGNTSF